MSLSSKARRRAGNSAPRVDAAALRRALQHWSSTGEVPVAYIVADPDLDDLSSDDTLAA